MYHNQMFDLCKNNMYRYVLVQTNDQQTFDGIIENVDNTNLYLAVPVGQVMEREERDERLLPAVGLGALGLGLGAGALGAPGFGVPAYGFPGYGVPGYGYPGHGFGYRPRRFQRLVLPLAAITALSLLPYY